MARIGPGGDGQLVITPTDLQEKSGIFSKASADLLDLESSLSLDANNLINEMVAVLDQSPDALQRFFQRWRTALLSLSDAYSSIGINLQRVAEGAQTWDARIGRSFDPGDGTPRGNGHFR